MTRRASPWLALASLALGAFMIGVSTTSMNTALPAIGTGLDATFDELLWALNVYSLVLAAFMITAGRMGDLYGQKRLYLLGLAVFALASVACGLAQSPGQLIAARVGQGIGGALLSPQTLSMISWIFPPERRGAANGVWGAVAGIAVAAGPGLGGLVVTALGWRWVFLLNVPICVLTAVCAALLIPRLGGGRRHRLDLAGAALATVGLFLVTYGLLEGQSHDWGPVWGPVPIPAVVGAGVVVLGVFVVVERGRQEREPLLPYAILADRNFSLMGVVTVTLVAAVGAMLLLLSIYLQSALGMSALAAGLVMAVAPAVSTGIAPVAGRLTDRLGGKYVLVVGLALFAAGLVQVLAVARADGSWLDLLPGLVVVGVAMGVTFAPPPTIAMYGIAPSLAGAASGTLNTIRMFGATIGAAAVGAVVQARLETSVRAEAAARAAQLAPELREPFVAGIARASAGGVEIDRQRFVAEVAAGLPDVAAAALREAADEVFRAGLTGAVRTTLLVPAALLLASVVITLAVRHRPPAPVAAPGSAASATAAAPDAPQVAGAAAGAAGRP
ncbi:MAG TPA: MFS transporter [Pilimelia sp.]|nr:MFS transporter [Pilimelia sp.]